MVALVRDEFRNLAEYSKWVDTKMQTLSELNKGHQARFNLQTLRSRIASDGSSWYGEGTTAEELVAGITQYRKPELIERLLGKVKEEIPAAMSEQVQSRKMEFNDRGMGLFSFDRAAMGLYRIKELHSPSLGKTVDREECSESDGVFTLIEDGSEVIERWELKPDGKPKIRTITKKVFAWFPKRSKEREAVEIYIGCGGNSNLNAEQMLYSGLGAIVFAEILAKAHIPTKITIAIGSSDDGWETSCISLVPVKNYDETLDSNLLATLSSDPRFFRHEGFKGIVATYDQFGKECPWSLGSCIDRETLMKSIENSTYTKTAKLAANRFYFGGTYNEQDAIKQIGNAITTLSNNLNR